VLSLTNTNGIVAYNEKDILIRNFIKQFITLGVKNILRSQNKAWGFHEIEGSCLISNDQINPEYSESDYFKISDTLSLKPETTALSYAYANQLLTLSHKPPLCVFQASKSFRKEQDQATKHCRFKEFFQLEFQCIYSISTKNEYQENVIKDLGNLVLELLKLPTRIVTSDRLPSYSLNTLDIEVNNGDKWMEVCSVSKRTDFSSDHFVLEIAFGLDRLLYNFNQATNNLILETENE
jgi:glycyl-tRNA synthetase